MTGLEAPCPICGARVGQVCAGLSEPGREIRVHGSRFMAAQAAVNAAAGRRPMTGRPLPCPECHRPAGTGHKMDCSQQ